MPAAQRSVITDFFFPDSPLDRRLDDAYESSSAS